METDKDREAKAMAEVNANTRQVIEPPESDGSLWADYKTYGTHTPCLRECLMYSTLISGAFGAMELVTGGAGLKVLPRFRKTPMQIGDMMIGTFLITSLGTWFLCRYQLINRQRNHLRNIAFSEEEHRRREGRQPGQPVPRE